VDRIRGSSNAPQSRTPVVFPVDGVACKCIDWICIGVPSALNRHLLELRVAKMHLRRAPTNKTKGKTNTKVWQIMFFSEDNFQQSKMAKYS
jgi:hypothetical protein